MAPRSPFLVTAPDVFWVPGRGALGEVPGALASPDMPVRSSATLGRPRGPGGETGLRGVPPGVGGTGDLYSAATARPPCGVASASLSTTTVSGGLAGGSNCRARGATWGRRRASAGAGSPGAEPQSGAGRAELQGAGLRGGRGRRRAGGGAEPQGGVEHPRGGARAGRPGGGATAGAGAEPRMEPEGGAGPGALQMHAGGYSPREWESC